MMEVPHEKFKPSVVFSVYDFCLFAMAQYFVISFFILFETVSGLRARVEHVKHRVKLGARKTRVNKKKKHKRPGTAAITEHPS